MSIGDLPRFPKEYSSRGAMLVGLLEQDREYGNELTKNIISTLGTLTIDSKGINVNGDFGSFHIETPEFQAISETLVIMLDFMKRLIKRRLSMLREEKKVRELFLKIDGKTTKIRIKPIYIQKSKDSFSPEEVRSSDLPVIELIPTEYLKLGARPGLDMLAWYFGGRGRPTLADYYKLRIHNVEDLVDWLDWEWDRVGELLKIGVPIIHITTKEILEKLGESYPAFWDEVLSRCGV